MKPAPEGVHGPRWGRWTATVRDQVTGKPTLLGVFTSAAAAEAALKAFRPPPRKRYPNKSRAFAHLLPKGVGKLYTGQ